MELVMAENEVLPKSNKSKDWLTYADSKLKEFKDYHSQRNILGQIKNPPPLQDEYSKILSQNELSARKMGMELLRKERTEQGAATMQKYRMGGRVKRTGPAKLHEGEAVVRKAARKNTRKSSR
jgi:hypothetical protein